MQVVIVRSISKNIPPSKNHNYFFDNIDKGLGVYCTYEKVALAGDFNAQLGEKLFNTIFISTRTYFH